MNQVFQYFGFDLISKKVIERKKNVFFSDVLNLNISVVILLILQFDLYDYEQDLNVVNDNNFLNLLFLIFDYLEKK